MGRGTATIGGVDKNGSMPFRLKYLFIATVFAGSFIIIYINKIPKIVYLNNDASMDYIPYNVLTNYSASFTIQTKGCTIPALRPFGEEIKKFTKYPKSNKPCPATKLALLGNNSTHIWVREENKIRYNIYDNRILICCYKSFYRPISIKDITASNIDERVIYSKCKNFSEIIDVTDEFVSVECKINGNTVYEQYYLFAPKKKTFNETPANKTAYNVIVMGIDAVSRLNFYRTMPKTLAFLKENGAVELLGYNKVGDNTFPNLVPILMGLSVKELNTTCTPNKRSSFDNCPLLWEYFKEAGYYTAFGEDSASLGLFNYVRNGFIKTPTDYYIHTFIREAERNVGMNKDFNSFLCMNEKFFYKVLLDYIENLSLSLRASKLFGFFWEITMSHDYLNYPMLMDNDYRKFLEIFLSSNYLNETILILLSDHGIRWGQITSTQQGRLEGRLPFVYILTPSTFQKKYDHAYNNLLLNSQRLTTPYDLHATLIDLINLENIENGMIEFRSNQSYVPNNKGVSLFLPVPTNRTCASAHIADHWCTCHKGKKLSTKTLKALDVAGRLLQELNSLLRDYVQCARLKLVKVVELTEMAISTLEKDLEWTEYLVVIRTDPGNALFEGTMRNYSETWSLAGTVSRLNLYGNQSSCINNDLLKLYCYCL